MTLTSRSSACTAAVSLVATICLTATLLSSCAQNAPDGSRPHADATRSVSVPKQRRILYNFDGDSCLYTRAGSNGPVDLTVADLRRAVEEVTGEDSQVDTVLVCIGARATYYPTKVGTMRGHYSEPEEREKWPAGQKQRFKNIAAFFEAGVDPYAVMLDEAKKRGREALLTFRINDGHTQEFLRTKFFVDKADYRLGRAQLDFYYDEVRDHTFRLIEEAVQRYDCDGIELDFNRFPSFFHEQVDVETRVKLMNELLERVRKMLDVESAARGRRLVLGARIPSNYNTHPPTHESARALGCDAVAWAENGWVDFLVVTEFLFENYDLPIAPWKDLITDVPIYGSIECIEAIGPRNRLTPEKYRHAARRRWQEGADGIYLFNFFTTREGDSPTEPPFDVLSDLGDRQAMLALPKKPNPTAPRKRRILYNFDGDSCLYTRAGGKGPVATTVDDLKRLIDEIAYDGSQVDTMLLCLNAATMYYPTQIGTLRGSLTPRDQRQEKWPQWEQQRVENVERFFAQGVDPFALIFNESKEHGLETLITFRMNDAHGNEFLRTNFWEENPEYRLPKGAYDFSHEAVRDHVFALIEEAVRRYDTDGLELDFNRYPTFFKKEKRTYARVALINSVVARVRHLLDKVGEERGQRLVLGARIPSDYLTDNPPSYEASLAAGCDPVAWARNGWVDFLVVTEFYFQRYDLPIAPWKKLISQVPIYGSIECTEARGYENWLTPTKYRRAARHLWTDGADGIYLFNFFTSREHDEESHEPPFEILGDIGDRTTLRD